MWTCFRDHNDRIVRGVCPTPACGGSSVSKSGFVIKIPYACRVNVKYSFKYYFIGDYLFRTRDLLYITQSVTWPEKKKKKFKLERWANFAIFSSHLKAIEEIVYPVFCVLMVVR